MKYKVTFQIQADATVEVEAPDNASFNDVLKLVTPIKAMDADVEWNSDVVRETFEELTYNDDPSLWFSIMDEDFMEID